MLVTEFNLLSWSPGRQGTGYRKLCLMEGKRWDVHVIDYPPGVGIPNHFDLILDRKHLRINFALLTGGAQLKSESVLFRLRERLVVFWSDKFHSVSTTTSRRIVVSLGIAI